MIRIEDLTVDLGEFILNDINLEIERGEYFVVLGPTGAGKSVLLETIAGLYQPKKGLIEINGRDVTRAEPRKRNISIVYQDYMLFPHLTVKENIKFGLKEKSRDLDKMAVMNGGGILQVGTPEQVFRKPNSEFIANFVGVENLFKGKSVIDTGTGIAYIDVKGIKIVSTSCKSGDVFISIRPEDILVSTERIETSARNSYRGAITEILDRGAITKIIVDVCISFAVVITKRSFEDMALKEGMLVYITFKASAVHVF